MTLTSKDSEMAQLIWPVTCKVEQWDLPRCRTNITTLEEQVKNGQPYNVRSRANNALLERLEEMQGKNSEKEKLKEKLLKLKY